MLKQFIHAYIPHFDCGIGACCSYTCTAGVEIHMVNKPVNILIRQLRFQKHKDLFISCMLLTQYRFMKLEKLNMKANLKHTYPPCSKNVCTQSLLCLSQTLTVLSSLHDTINRPSGENLCK